jgi:hypothetical protein
MARRLSQSPLSRSSQARWRCPRTACSAPATSAAKYVACADRAAGAIGAGIQPFKGRLPYRFEDTKADVGPRRAVVAMRRFRSTSAASHSTTSPVRAEAFPLHTASAAGWCEWARATGGRQLTYRRLRGTPWLSVETDRLIDNPRAVRARAAIPHVCGRELVPALSQPA